jgi:hypothetical protein
MWRAPSGRVKPQATPLAPCLVVSSLLLNGAPQQVLNVEFVISEVEASANDPQETNPPENSTVAVPDHQETSPELQVLLPLSSKSFA